MYKLDFKEYFSISKFLSRLEQQKSDELDVTLEKKNPFQTIVTLYKKYGENEDRDSPLYDFLKQTRLLLLSSLFFLVMLFSFMEIHKSINIKIYLLFGLLLPFLYLISIAWQTLFYKFPKKEENSFVAFMTKKYSQYDKRDTHVLKTFTSLLLVEMGIVYTFTILLSTIFIFWAYSIQFYSESSYTFLDPIKIWFHTTNGHTELPQDFFALAITLSIAILLVLKIFIWFLAKRNLQKAMREALLLKGETILERLSQSVSIKISSNNQENRENFEIQKDTSHHIDRLHYDLLFYQFEEDKKIIDILELKNDADLITLQPKYHTYALYGEEESDRKTLLTVQNLVIVVTSPQTIPDNTFKEDMLTLLETKRVRQIWVIPLVEKDGTLQKAYKGDYLYEEWQKQINETINNYKIRLYNEK